MGVLHNLRNYFAQPYIFFWWPNAKDSKYEGYWFPRVGISRETVKCSTKISNKCRINGCDIQVESNSKFMDVAKMMYEGHTFIFHDMMIQPDGSVTETNKPIIGGHRRIERKEEEVTEDKLTKD